MHEPWPWYISGPMIALILFLLLMVGKNFGVSANLRTLCTICGADKKIDFFDFDWKSQKWNLIFIVGTVFGGFLAKQFLTEHLAVTISTESISRLHELGFQSAGKSYLPNELFDTNALFSMKAILILSLGGILVGFGARYAGGCTSGHAISGLSDLQLPSLIAVVGFFIGGLIMTHLIFPLIF